MYPFNQNQALLGGLLNNNDDNDGEGNNNNFKFRTKLTTMNWVKAAVT
jgi:hypothetical protein